MRARIALLRSMGTPRPYQDTKPLEIVEVDLDEPGFGEVRVKMAAAGLCHSDLSVINGDRPRDMPVALGHEASGVIEAVGPGVSGVTEGDHVVMSFDSCGSCANCRDAVPGACPQMAALNMIAVPLDGRPRATDAEGNAVGNRWFGQSSFASHALGTVRNVVPVTKDVPIEKLGPLGCGVQTGAASVLVSLGVRAGDGIAVFGERFRAPQWLGMALLVAGLGLFFRDQFVHVDATPGHAGTGAYLAGSLLVVLAAVVWAVYALAQKQLLVTLGSMQVLAVIYVVATLLLWPFAHPSHLARLDGAQWALLAFCALNTVVAYGAFAEALAHWEASRVSAVLAMTPLLCLGVVAIVHALWPGMLAPEPMSAIGWIGALLVVAGSAAVSLLGRRRA